MPGLWDILIVVVSSGTIVAVIEWLRYRRRDRAEADHAGAQASQVEASRRQLDIETTNAVRDLWKELSNDMREAMNHQRARIDDLEQESGRQRSEIDALNASLRSALEFIDELLSGIRRLIQQIKDLGHAPVWEPPARKEKK